VNDEEMEEFDRKSGKVMLHIPLREASHGFTFYGDPLGVMVRSSFVARGNMGHAAGPSPKFFRFDRQPRHED
jgi:hypothetical protein